MVKPDATKPTRDTPVSPAEAIEHLRGIEQKVKGHMEKLPDHNPDSFGLGAVRPIRNQGLVVANTSLQVGGEKLGVNVRGREETAKQKTDKTLVTVNDGGKETIFEPRRNEQGQVSFVNQATVGEQGRKNGILKPQTLEDFVVDKVAQTPNKEFTNQATVKPVRQELALADGAPKIEAPAVAGGATKVVQAPDLKVEGDAAATARAAATPRGNGAPAITAGSSEGLAGIKAPNLTVEANTDAGQRVRDAGVAAKVGGQQRDIAAGQAADAILAGSKTPLALEEATVGGTGKGGATAGKVQTAWRAGTTKLRTPGAPGGGGF